MPIYEYSCKDCSNISEFIVKAGEIGQTLSCKKCGGLNLQKILSVSNIATTVSGSACGTCEGRQEGCDQPACGSPCSGH